MRLVGHELAVVLAPVAGEVEIGAGGDEARSVGQAGVRLQLDPFRLVRLLAAGLLLAAPAAAHGFKVGPIEIEHPWSRATPPGARTGAGYLAMSNEGAQADRLVADRSARAETVQVHRMSVADGVMTMRRVEERVEIPAGGSAALTPGSLHLMLFGLRARLREGERVPVVLKSEKAGEVEVERQVEAIGAKGPDHGEPADAAHAP